MPLTTIEWFVAGAVVTSLVMNGFRSLTKEVTTVVSKTDGRNYVVRDVADKDLAVELLADINQTVQKFINRLRTDHPDDVRIKHVEKRFDPDSVSEGSHETGYTSYSVNKGEKIVVCMRQKDNSFVKKNELMYVVIHELAHLSTDEIGHTPTFWENFKFLLNEAVKQGLYTYVNYAVHPSPYCGINISSSIISDPSS
jgi:hypothetical protein